MRVRPLLSITLGAMALGAGSLDAQPHEVEIVVIVAGVGAPIVGALVQVKPGGPRAVTDAEGRVVLQGLAGDEVEIEVSRIGFGTEEVIFSLPRSDPFRVALGIRAMELEGLEVEGRMRRPELTSPGRRDLIHGAALARAEMHGAEIRDLLRTIPGVNVTGTEVRFVRALRGVGRGPANALVLVDRFPTWGALDIPLYRVQSIRVLQPSEATFLYGPRASGGAIEIWTRGKGPFRDDPARDCAECE